MTSTVRVVGAPRAGVTSLAGALRSRLTSHDVVEADSAGEPAAIVVAACSAVAPLTASDCAAIDVHARSADVVIGVLTKVDAHRRWREVLVANRAALAAYAPRYRDLTWVGAAAAPDVGEPRLDDLVRVVRDPSTRLPRPRPNALQRHAPQRRMSDEASARLTGVALRDEVHRLRIRLGRHHRRRCAALRTDFRDRAARASRAEAADFGTEFTQAAQRVLVDLRERIGEGLTDLRALADVPLADPGTAPSFDDVTPELPPAPRGPGAAEGRLTLALGAGFGLGVAATVGRAAAAMAPRLAIAAAAVAILAGCLLTAWLVCTRALLHRRAALDRWVTEAVTAVRSHGEDMMADALLDAQALRGRGGGP